MTEQRDHSTASERPDLIEALVADLRAVEPAPTLARTLASWIGFGLLSTTLAVLALGGLHETALADLASPRFALEHLAGIASLIALAYAALEIDVPGAPRRSLLLVPIVLLGSLWLAIAVGARPLHALEASMLGKRAHCFLEGLVIAIPPVLIGMRMVRRRSLRASTLGGVLLGLAAGALPALAMQLACLRDPDHALRFHFTPMLVAALALGLAQGAGRARDRRSASPGGPD